VVIDSCTVQQDCPGFLENSLRTGLLPLSGSVGNKEKCPIQIYVTR
jgi:hypothetical protein